MTEMLYADIGYQSLTKMGQVLCGDHIEKIELEDGTVIIVLSDGLGSGVKACILSTLTATMLSKMLSENLDVDICVEAVVSALPICKVRQLAYATFTVVKISPTGFADIIQYDSPEMIYIRDGEVLPVPFKQIICSGKEIQVAKLQLKSGDTLISMSDGAENAGVKKGMSYDHAWGRDAIAEYIAPLCFADFSAKTLNSILLDECYKKYEGEVYDDTTTMTICMKPRQQVNLLFGAPADKNDDERVLDLFFSKMGKYVVCGGTTAKIVSKYLNKPIEKNRMQSDDPEIPDTSVIQGVDLVTEGIITIDKVLFYARDYLGENLFYEKWSFSRDGASEVARMLFETATDINVFIGQAVNPAHQNPNLPINFNVKMQIIKDLVECLRQMGKTIRVNYF